MLTDKKIFLTGGAGFIGSTLIGSLIERNKICVFDNFARDTLSSTPYAHHPNVAVVTGDVTDRSALRQAMLSFEPDVVVHLAAIAGIETVIKSPTGTMRVNLLGTINALD